MNQTDVLVIGAGAAGLMCAIHAGRRRKAVIVLDHAKKPAEKIRISGGGKCNFTNLHCTPENFISSNPHFCKSALSRFCPQDFIKMVDEHKISWHEKNQGKKSGQLFCNDSSAQIVDMLLLDCQKAAVKIHMETEIKAVEKAKSGFEVTTNSGTYICSSLVIACGGRSIPKMGASGFGYKIARQFGLNVIPPSPALVPLTFTDDILQMTKSLSGLSIEEAVVTCGHTSFREAVLFTHRGLSGPAILQISSYWSPGQSITLNMLPDMDMFEQLKKDRSMQPKQMLHTLLEKYLPARLAQSIAVRSGHDGRIADLSDKKLKAVANIVNNWTLQPNGTEGFRTAEVTGGGVDTDELSSKTFESKKVPGLYFIGEVVDVTGHLGGHNFQWAWASGHACGTAL
ncbi:MAG: NAD(P)/FAD-dependent oxidoreductase [Rhodospirillales bacterium]|nr:NAD(P)/FAD-dependent oxidoreductase [Alphaproteobacteria bacterium]USO03953.1 MAG: NAD(P)/FAD-dependent oxidoreductase [Rhodospirillales bacterium]